MRVVITLALMLAACGQPETKADAASPPAAEPAPVAWETRLSEMLPYIDACISKSPETRYVNYAGLLNDREVAVRLGGAPGEFVCTVPTADPSAANAAIVPDDENEAFAGEGSATFVRGPGDNPGGECYEAEEVRNADGELIGWWADPHGC
ncbi:MAG TPA: hypothetical protein VEF55_05525 [Candidatus Binatia bacterium]|nr:hypothetical protein [Candidatus Binatia bacterium]